MNDANTPAGSASFSAEQLAELDAKYAAMTPGEMSLVKCYDKSDHATWEPTTESGFHALAAYECNQDEENARGFVALHNSYPALSAALKEAWADLAYERRYDRPLSEEMDGDLSKEDIWHALRRRDMQLAKAAALSVKARAESASVAARLTVAEELLREAQPDTGIELHDKITAFLEQSGCCGRLWRDVTDAPNAGVGAPNAMTSPHSSQEQWLVFWAVCFGVLVYTAPRIPQ